MLHQHRKQDIVENTSIEMDELEYEGNNVFKSIEYYCILHYTNEELYYLDDEQTFEAEEAADEIVTTELGIIYLMS